MVEIPLTVECIGNVPDGNLISTAVLKGFITEKTVHQARIVDLVFHKNNWRRHISEVIQKKKPDLVGFSVLSFNYPDALKIADFIKKKFDVKIIFGGVHVILSPHATKDHGYSRSHTIRPHSRREGLEVISVQIAA